MKTIIELKQEDAISDLTYIQDLSCKQSAFKKVQSGSQVNDKSPRKQEIIQQQEGQQDQKPKEIQVRPKWETSCHYKFIQCWQTIFNRRVISICGFSIQVGDIVIFSLAVSFLIYTCLKVKFAKASGQMAELMMAFTIMFGCRNGLISYFFGLSLERAVLWHQFFAWITFGLSIHHWFTSAWIKSGYVIESSIVGFIVFSFKPIRKYQWELFMRMHWLLIILMFIGSILHKVGLGFIFTLYFLADVCYRLYTVCKHSHMSKEMKLERIGPNITKISMKSRGCVYKGGQYFFVMIPKISYFQWHPFSVFSASFEEEIVIYVKCLGDWTNQLYQYAGLAGKPVTVRGFFDGPYGSHSISIEGDKYKNFLCISGGIGVTPIISTVKEMFHQMEEGRPIKNLLFIWTGRDSALIERVFKPDELQQLLSLQDVQILKTFFHYSEKGDKKISDIEKKSVSKQKPIVVLDQGKPDFEKYFEKAHKNAKQSGHSLVGVLICGPQSLINLVETLSMRWSKSGVRFDVHQEVFDF